QRLQIFPYVDRDLYQKPFRDALSISGDRRNSIIYSYGDSEGIDNYAFSPESSYFLPGLRQALDTTSRYDVHINLVAGTTDRFAVAGHEFELQLPPRAARNLKMLMMEKAGIPKRVILDFKLVDDPVDFTKKPRIGYFVIVDGESFPFNPMLY